MVERIIKLLINVYILPITRFRRVSRYILNKVHIDCIQRSINLVKASIQNDMCIVDVGAYTGFPGDTTPSFAESFPSNMVYAFEPFEENYRMLKKNVGKYENVIPLCTALSDVEKSGKLYVTAQSASSSLLEINNEEVEKLKKEYSKSIKNVKEEIIEITTLDSFVRRENIKKIAILKIDTQGAELSVLKGAQEALKDTILVMLENNNHNSYNNSAEYYETDEFLRKSNFTLYDIVPSLYEKGKIYEWDSIYVNKQYLATINENRENDSVLPF